MASVPPPPPPSGGDQPRWTPRVRPTLPAGGHPHTGPVGYWGRPTPDPALLNRRPPQPTWHNYVRAAIVVTLVAALGGCAVLVVKGARAQRQFGQFPAVSATPDPRSMTLTHREATATPATSNGPPGAWTIRLDLHSGQADAVSTEGHTEGDVYHRDDRWRRQLPTGEWIAPPGLANQALPDVVNRTRLPLTIDVVIPPDLRDFVTIVSVEADERDGRSLRRFDTVLDLRRAQSHAPRAVDEADRFWRYLGHTELRPGESGISIIVWVDDDGVVWGWGSTGQFSYDYLYTHVVEVSDEPFVPAFPPDFPLASAGD